MDISTSDLRTLLAGMAMQGLLANPKNNPLNKASDLFCLVTKLPVETIKFFINENQYRMPTV